MATLVRDIERPAFLDRPADGQLSFSAVAAPARGRAAAGGTGLGRAPLSERLRDERTATVGAAQTVATRGGGATLDELLVGAWEGLSARHPVACPVCAGPMLPRAGAAGGACGDCGSHLR